MIVRVCALLAGAGLAAASLAALPAMAQPKVSPAIAAAVTDPGRVPADVARDKDRKPAETLAFAGIHSGQKIGELFPGSGYYTRMLSKIVGPTGHVWLMSPSGMQARLQKGADDLAASLPNTSVLFQPSDSPMTPEKADVIWTTDNYHDYRNPSFGSTDMEKFNRSVFDSLKPGGEFIVVDYAAASGAGATQTGTNHRIELATVKAEVEAAGFKLEKESPILHNEADDHTLKIFDPKVRGRADQFVLLFRKPK